MSSKQVIVVRNDLKDSNANPVGFGKLAAQIAHASLCNILNLIKRKDIINNSIVCSLSYPLDSPEQEWIENSFTKIILSVNSEEELLAIYRKANSLGLNTSLITDEGRTCFNNIPTVTCAAIGPHSREAFLGLTDHLRMY